MSVERFSVYKNLGEMQLKKPLMIVGGVVLSLFVISMMCSLAISVGYLTALREFEGHLAEFIERIKAKEVDVKD